MEDTLPAGRDLEDDLGGELEGDGLLDDQADIDLTDDDISLDDDLDNLDLDDHLDDIKLDDDDDLE